MPWSQRQACTTRNCVIVGWSFHRISLFSKSVGLASAIHRGAIAVGFEGMLISNFAQHTSQALDFEVRPGACLYPSLANTTTLDARSKPPKLWRLVQRLSRPRVACLPMRLLHRLIVIPRYSSCSRTIKMKRSQSPMMSTINNPL